MRKLFLLICCIPFPVFAQNATFIADTTFYFPDIKSGARSYAMDLEWKIRGHLMRFGSPALSVPVRQGQWDTIFFKRQPNAPTDTLLCCINEANTYRFRYNTCCGGIDVMTDDKKYITGSVMFKLTQPSKKTFMGILDQVGVLAKEQWRDTAFHGCRSAMASNVYTIRISEIKICKDTTGCANGICFNNNDECYEHFGFKTIFTTKRFLWMPLSEKPLKLIYDPLKKKFILGDF